MNDADAWEAGEEGALDEALDFGLGFVGGAADDVDLGADEVVVAGGGDGDAAAVAEGLRRRFVHGCDFSDVGARDASLHGAEADFERVGVDQAHDAAFAVERFEADEIADARLVCAGGV